MKPKKTSYEEQLDDYHPSPRKKRKEEVAVPMTRQGMGAKGVDISHEPMTDVSTV